MAVENPIKNEESKDEGEHKTTLWNSIEISLSNFIKIASPFEKNISRAQRINRILVIFIWLSSICFNIFKDNDNADSVTISGHTFNNFLLIDNFWKFIIICVVPYGLLRQMNIALGLSLFYLTGVLSISLLQFFVNFHDKNWSFSNGSFGDILEICIFGIVFYAFSRNDILGIYKMQRKIYFRIIGAAILLGIVFFGLLMIAFATDSL